METIYVNYPDANAKLSNAVVYADETAYPPVSTVTIEKRFDSDNNVFVPSVSTQYIYKKTALLVQDTTRNIPNNTIFGDNGSIDAFGRLRVSNPQTLLDYKQIYDKAPYVFNEVIVGSASSVQVSGDASVIMQTSASGSYVIRQTTARFNYQGGISILASFTGTYAPETNIIKRVGAFHGMYTAPYEPADGIYLESRDSGMYLNIKKIGGTTNTEVIPQSAWNIDRLDGTGPSGLTLDFTKSQIFTLDYEWLGIGRVRAGFFYNGNLIYAHAFNHTNVLEGPYMSYASQPVRYEIRQTGAGSGTMRHICTGVIAEGGEQDLGTSLTVDMSGVVTGIDTTFRPVLAVRLNANATNVVTVLRTFQAFNTGANDAIVKIFFDPVITGGSLSFVRWLDSSVDWAVGSSSLGLSGGRGAYTTFITKATGGGGTEQSGEILGNLNKLGTKIDGTTTTLVLAAKSLASTTSMWGTFNLVEKA